MISIDKWTTIRTLHKEGHSKRAIAKMMGVSRNTVKRALYKSKLILGHLVYFLSKRSTLRLSKSCRSGGNKNTASNRDTRMDSGRVTPTRKTSKPGMAI
jgi:IS30 family transposase